MSKTYIQVRADEKDKELATKILDDLGTNLSTVINMLLKQIIMTKSVPFEVKLNNSVYSDDEVISEISSTMAMENMNLTKEDIELLKAYRKNKGSAEDLIEKIISEYKQE